MRKNVCFNLPLAVLLGCGGCGQGRQPDPYDLDFEVPQTHSFAPTLDTYGLFQAPGSFQPAQDVLLYELSSELFTDYAYKQRLVRVPEGATIATGDHGELEFPEGTILAKSFYYPHDMRDDASEVRILETRLLVKSEGAWNAATYLWNEQQDGADLLLAGTTMDVTWIGRDGQTASTTYAVPSEGECYTCHQADEQAAYIGPTRANLNRRVRRDGQDVQQLNYLAQQGILSLDAQTPAPVVPDYRDETLPLQERARAYLDINCAHCHRPSGWDELSDRELDFRYTTPMPRTGLERRAEDLPRLLERGEMPYLGTTLPHVEGIDLLTDYANSL